jgi:hypothetical protein
MLRGYYTTKPQAHFDDARENFCSSEAAQVKILLEVSCCYYSYERYSGAYPCSDIVLMLLVK